MDIRYELADLGIEAPRQYNEASMTIALSTLRMMAGSHWTWQEIQFAHAAPDRTSEHVRIFTAPVLFLASIGKAIGETMRDGDPKLARVAKKLAASPRTLQRKLKEYGVEFKKLTEDTRRRFALNYLRDH